MKSFTDGLLEHLRNAPRPSMASLGSAIKRPLRKKERRDEAFVDREVKTDAHQVCTMDGRIAYPGIRVRLFADLRASKKVIGVTLAGKGAYWWA